MIIVGSTVVAPTAKVIRDMPETPVITALVPRTWRHPCALTLDGFGFEDRIERPMLFCPREVDLDCMHAEENAGAYGTLVAEEITRTVIDARANPVRTSEIAGTRRRPTLSIIHAPVCELLEGIWR